MTNISRYILVDPLSGPPLSTSSLLTLMTSEPEKLNVRADAGPGPGPEPGPGPGP